jgi:hypothetical protein
LPPEPRVEKTLIVNPAIILQYLNRTAPLPGNTPRKSPDPAMSSLKEEHQELVRESLLYKEFLAEREEILRHKWLESEKVGHDIGFERALLDWIVKYRSNWRQQRKGEHQPA